MEDFKKLAPIRKQITIATIQLLYENGFDEDQVVGMLNKTHGINLSQKTIRHFYNQFLRADIQADARTQLLLEFSAG